MPEDDPLQTLRAARDALRTSLKAAVHQGSIMDPDALDRMLRAHEALQKADQRLALEEAKRAPLVRRKQRGGPSS